MNNKLGILLSTLIPFTVLSAKAAEEWEPSKVSEKTWDKVHQARVGYDACLNQQLVKVVGSDADPRALADGVLKTCEERLSPIREAFAEEKVPVEMIDRYLRQQRSRAAQALMPEIMGAQAVRQAQKDTPKAGP